MISSTLLSVGGERTGGYSAGLWEESEYRVRETCWLVRVVCVSSLWRTAMWAPGKGHASAVRREGCVYVGYAL